MNLRLRLLSASVLSLGLAGMGILQAQEHNHGVVMEKSTIVVTGEAEIKAKPDIARINVGVLATAPTAVQAMSENSQKMNALFDVLKANGVAEKDIRTSNLSVSPQYSQPQPGMPRGGEFIPRIVGYNVTNTVSVTVRKIETLGSMLDLLLQNGANQVNGISFDIDKQEELLDTARHNAVSNARKKAQLYCEGEKIRPGRILHIQEAGTSLPRPQPYASGFAMRAMAADSAPIAGGETELSVRVQVVFELVSE